MAVVRRSPNNFFRLICCVPTLHLTSACFLNSQEVGK